MPRQLVHNENVIPERGLSLKPTKLSASTNSLATKKRRPLGENAPAPASAPPTQLVKGGTKDKPQRSRSVLAPLADPVNASASASASKARPPRPALTPTTSARNIRTAPNVGKLPRLKTNTCSSSSSAALGSAELRARAKETMRPRPPHTPPRQPPKTPAEQVGKAGAVRAALLARKRPITVPDPVKRPRVQRSISVRADEVHAAPRGVGGYRLGAGVVDKRNEVDEDEDRSVGECQD